MSLYENERNLEGIRARIEKDLDRNQTLLAAWEAVSFPTKKDGKPFAIMSKNFSGANYRHYEYALAPEEFELHVAKRSEKTGAYYDDTLNMWDSVQRANLDTIEKKENLHKPSNPYLCYVYSYDLEDAKQAINNRIAYYEKSVAQYKKDLEEVENAYKTFLKSFENAIAELEEVAGSKSLADLVEGTICNNYPYCK